MKTKNQAKPNEQLIKKIYPNLSKEATFIRTVNDPVQLPFGGTLELERRMVMDEDGETRYFKVGQVCLAHEYVYYMEDEISVETVEANVSLREKFVAVLRHWFIFGGE
jgi:hypothetical protein